MSVAHALGSQKPLGRHSLALLIGLQLLLVLTVALGGWGASAYLRQLTLTQTLEHAQAQAYNLEDALSQSFHLLKMHLQALGEDHPDLAQQPQQLQVAMAALQQKLPYIRSLSALDGQGKIHISTDPANVGQRLLLGELQHSVAPGAAGVLRFGHPWRGRNFADGTPWPRHREGGLVVDSGFFPVTLVLPGAPQWTLLATINSDYFINLALNHQTSVALRYSVYSDDGTLLFSTNENAQPGTLMPRAEALQDILERQVGTAHWPQTRTQEAEVAAFRASRSYPWLVLAQAQTQEVLRPWRQQTERLAVIAVLSVLGLLLVTGSLTWRVRRVLAQEERHLEASRLAASVFSHSSDLIAITDSLGRVLTVNPTFERTLGFSAQEVVGRKLGEWQDGRAAPAGLTPLWTALASEDTWEGKVQERCKDGSELIGWLAASAIRDARQQVVNYVFVLRDLSRLHADEATIRKLSQVVEQSPLGILITSTAPAIEYGNPEFFRICGFSPEELLGVNPRIMQSGQTPVTTYRAMWAALKQGNAWEGEFINRRKDGSLYIENTIVAPLLNADGQTTHYLGIKQDITANKEAEKALRLAASVVTQTHEGVMICDAQQLITDINPAFTRITGYTREQVLGRKPSILSAGRKNQEGYIAMSAALAASGHWSGEFWNRRPDGSVYATANSMNTITDDAGQIAYYINVFQDVTERRQQQEFLESLAHFDPLTRLPNRTLLNDRIAQAMGRAGRAQSLLGVCFLDLDGFKAVNDTWGHEAGDDLLIVIARRLEACVRAEDTVARLGGDEFVVLLTAVTDTAGCERAAARILASVREPIDVGGHTVHVGVSIGIALYPQDGDDAETLLRYADMAMYRAKQAGRNRWVLHADG